MEQVNKSNPFVGRPWPWEKPKRQKVSKDIEHIKEVDIVVKTGKGEEEFYVDKKIVVYETLNRRNELNKFKSDVGSLNVIRKLAKQGENAMDGRFSAPGQFVDATRLPQDPADLIKLSKELDPRTSKLWNSLPAELKGNMTLEEFAKKFNMKNFDEFLASKQKKVVKPEAKEGENK